MFEQVKHAWSELKASRPGTRFRERYERRNRSGGHGAVRKTLMIIAGAALVVVGVFGLVLPGPGLIAIALGGALVASESYVAATALDTLEVSARRALRTIVRR